MGYYDQADMTELVGKKVVGLSVSDGEDMLVFDTDAGPIAYDAVGDCCSTSWFADIVGTASILGGTVSGVEALDMPDVEDGRTRQEYDRVYGYRVRTERGTCDVIFRNSSNGYYGGWISHHIGPPPAAMRPITGDWQA